MPLLMILPSDMLWAFLNQGDGRPVTNNQNENERNLVDVCC